MRMTPQWQAAIDAVIAELGPAAEEMCKLAAEYNIQFRVNGVQVNIDFADIEGMTALSHEEFREIAKLSEAAKRGILRTYAEMITKIFDRGKEVGGNEVRGSMINLLGLQVGLSS